jgi:hypothetical protein
MAFVYFPHGAVMHEWTPATAGRHAQLGRILEPLTPFRDRLTIVSGLENRHADGPVHAITPGTWLSGVSPRASRDSLQGITADQMAAQHIGEDTRLPSIEVAAEERRISWHHLGRSTATATARRSRSARHRRHCRWNTPAQLFDTLFTQGDAAPRVQARGGRTSILDLVAPTLRICRSVSVLRTAPCFAPTWTPSATSSVV